MFTVYFSLHQSCKWLTVLYSLLFTVTVVVGDYDGDSFHGSIEHSVIQSACFRLFSNEGDIGCRTPSSSGSTGILFEIRNNHDITSASYLDRDVVYVIPGYFFNSSVLSILESTKLKGILVLDDDLTWSNIPTGSFSTDVQTPQGLNTVQSKFSINPNLVWNDHGNGIAYRSLRYSFFLFDLFKKNI